MLRVTLDSSAYISALEFNGRAARLLRMAADNDIEIAISEPIIAEVVGVLRERGSAGRVTAFTRSGSASRASPRSSHRRKPWM